MLHQTSIVVFSSPHLQHLKLKIPFTSPTAFIFSHVVGTTHSSLTTSLKCEMMAHAPVEQEIPSLQAYITEITVPPGSLEVGKSHIPHNLA